MTSVKISTPSELLTILPHQVGHQLQDCVVVAMVSGRLLGPVARLDLPDERDAARAAEHLLSSLLRVGPELALLVGYESVPGESRTMRHTLHSGLLGAGVSLIDHVLVRDGRWWGACCRLSPDSLEEVSAAHAEGHAIPDAGSVPAVAEMIATGSAPLASREEVAALVSEDPASSRRVGRALEMLDEELGGVDRVPELWARVIAPGGPRADTFEVSDDEVARMLRSLRDKQWRDALIAWMSSVMMPLDLVDDASSMLLAETAPSGPVVSAPWSRLVLQRVLALARRVPDDCGHDAAAICTVVACVAWGLGTGSTAGDAVSRALRLDPGYTLAAYLGRLIELQVRPERRWPDAAA